MKSPHMMMTMISFVCIILHHLLPHYVNRAKNQKSTPFYDIPLLLVFQDSNKFKNETYYFLEFLLKFLNILINMQLHQINNLKHCN
jgi:hypothetical protein